jgi:hypothetical protein
LEGGSSRPFGKLGGPATAASPAAAAGSLSRLFARHFSWSGVARFRGEFRTLLVRLSFARLGWLSAFAAAAAAAATAATTATPLTFAFARCLGRFAFLFLVFFLELFLGDLFLFLDCCRFRPRNRDGSRS